MNKRFASLAVSALLLVSMFSVPHWLRALTQPPIPLPPAMTTLSLP